MGIYIKGMEMPKNCEECQAVLGCCDELEDGTVWCRMAHGYIGDERTVCPLVPVSEHGRLIDADALEVHDCWMNESRDRNVQQTHITFVYSNDIANAPTIIPADHFGDTTEMVKAEEGK